MLIAVAAAVIAVAAVMLTRFFRGPNRAQYLAQNERVISRLPQPPWAREVLRQNLPVEKTVFGEQLSHVVGYTTHVDFRVPANVTAAGIIRFYERRLRRWHTSSWRVDHTPFACFDRGGATANIETDGMIQRPGKKQKSYGIAVDHRGGTCS